MSTDDPTGPVFIKGHGTENDFVLLPDASDELVLTPDLARRLCDRRTGVGGDGAIRIAPADGDRFLMDYRNSDGSPAEMCGNGARVFARFLVDAGWARAGRIGFDTRGGPRTADLAATGDVRIGMGPVRLGGPGVAAVAGREFPGTAVDVGNPHLVCLFDENDATPEDLDALDLSVAPGVDAGLFPEGVNVEFVLPVGPDELRMRVFERGAGETRSCGTGTVASAAAHLAATDRQAGVVTVNVLGGRVRVEITDVGADLIGPAVLTYSGTLNPDVLSS